MALSYRADIHMYFGIDLLYFYSDPLFVLKRFTWVTGMLEKYPMWQCSHQKFLLDDLAQRVVPVEKWATETETEGGGGLCGNRHSHDCC